MYESNDICEQCPHFDKITTPLQLSHSKALTIEKETREGDIDPETGMTELFDGEDYEFVPPHPFFFDESNRLMMTQDKKDVVVSNNRVVPVQRISNDKGNKHISCFHVLAKGEDVNTIRRDPIMIPQEEFTNPASVGLLNGANALIPPFSIKNMQNYLTKTIDQMNEHKQCKVSHSTIGWKDDDFLVGKYHISGDHDFREEKLSESLNNTVGDLGYKGTVDQWRKAVSVLGRDGMEPHMMCLMGGFAAPLFMSTDHAGILVNLLSRDSGTFKSFTLKMITSIYGKPEFNIITKRDTENAMMRKISSRSDLPITYDEITNIDPAALSNLVYALTQGKGRDRLNTAAEMMENMGVWRTVMFSSSNASLDEKLGAFSTAERMRLLEFSVQGLNDNEPIDPHKAAEVMDIISENYGGVGLQWIGHIVHNKARIFAKCRAKIREMSDKVGRSNDKRFWITYMALSLVAAEETFNLAMHSFDLTKMEMFAYSILDSHHEKLMGDKTNLYEMVDSFMTTHLDSTMVVKRRDTETGMGELVKEPHRELMVFVDNITGAPGTEIRSEVYINRAAMRIFLTERREDLNELIKQLLTLKVIVEENGVPKTNFTKRVPLSQVGGTDVGMRSFAIDFKKYNQILGEMKT